jgi:PIN domain nuclease of toxin-antitoxin system
VRLLLDTQVAYLWTIDDSGLPTPVTTALVNPRNHVCISAASFWEISIKHAKGKLNWPTEGFDALLDSDFRKLPISPEHAVAAGRLPLHHADPFDRVLIAQAVVEELTLVGSDPVFERYGVERLWE